MIRPRLAFPVKEFARGQVLLERKVQETKLLLVDRNQRARRLLYRLQQHPRTYPEMPQQSGRDVALPDELQRVEDLALIDDRDLIGLCPSFLRFIRYELQHETQIGGGEIVLLLQ